MKTIDQSTIRKQNVRRILDLLSNTPEMTRNALAEQTGLSLMTVSNLVDLLKSHEVLSFTTVAHTGPRASGRKAEILTLSSEKHAWLVLEINSQSLRFTLLGFDQKLLDKGCFLIEGSEDDFVSQLSLVAAQLRDRIAAPLGSRNLLGVAIITPDSYNKDSDTLLCYHLPQKLSYFQLKKLLHDNLGPYHYIADKNVKYAVRAFSILLEHAEYPLFYFLCIGEVLGGAVVHNDSLLYGRNHSFGDAGLFHDKNGISYDSQLSLSAFARELGLSDVSYDALSAAAASDPDRYWAVLERFADKTSELMAELVCCFDPDHTVIECRYAHPFAERYLNMLREGLARRMADTGRILPDFSLVPVSPSIILSGAVHALQLEWIEQIIS